MKRSDNVVTRYEVRDQGSGIREEQEGKEKRQRDCKEAQLSKGSGTQGTSTEARHEHWG